MLDLTTYNGNVYEVKLLDGKVYHLKRPSQKLFSSLIEIQKADKEDAGKLIDVCMDLFLNIINRNQENVTFTARDLDEQGYDFMIAMALISDYVSYYSKEITSNVDFPTTQSTVR